MPSAAGRGGFLLALLLFPLILAAQPRRQDAFLYEVEPPLRCEAWSAPSADPGSSRLDVRFWVQSSVLVFTRQAGDTSATPFAASAEIAIEIFDSNRVACARKYFRRRLSSASNDDLASRPTTITDHASFLLPPGAYTVTAEVSDAESQRRITRKIDVTLAGFASQSFAASSIFWCRPAGPHDASDSSRPFFGDVIPLGEPAVGYLACAGLSRPDSARTDLRIYRIGGGTPQERTLVTRRSFGAGQHRAGAPAPDTLQQSAYFPYAPLRREIATFAIPMALDSLPVGRYQAEIMVADGSASTTITQPFSIAWTGMPRTLTSLPSAVLAMQHVMSKDEYSAIRKMDHEEQRIAFENFWRAKDPTPGNAFNEIMEEYYRRADIAAAEFATIRSPNGLTTDRGRVYILYGPPTSRERVLGRNAAPREVWLYQAMKKSLIFIDERRTGDYTLATEQ